MSGRLPFRHRNQRRDPATFRGVGNQGGKPLLLRFLSLGAHHPPDRRLAIGRRLPLEERPCLLVRAEQRLVEACEPQAFLLERVAVCFGGVALVERSQSRRVYPAKAGQLLGACDIDGTPDAALPTRREALAVACLVDRLGQPVNPAEAERLVDPFLIGDAWQTG